MIGAGWPAVAEVPNALVVPAHPSNYALRPNRIAVANLYDLVVIHCTDGRSRARPVADMWTKQVAPGGKKSSAHLVIDQDGSRIQCVPLRFMAFHAHNEAGAHSVGIEHCARTPGEFGHDDPGLPPSSALYASSAELVAWLLVAAGLPPDRDHVRGHSEVDKVTTHTECPQGCGWDWDQYMAMVQEQYKLLAPPPSPLVA